MKRSSPAIIHSIGGGGRVQYGRGRATATQTAGQCRVWLNNPQEASKRIKTRFWVHSVLRVCVWNLHAPAHSAPDPSESIPPASTNMAGEAIYLNHFVCFCQSKIDFHKQEKFITCLCADSFCVSFLVEATNLHKVGIICTWPSNMLYLEMITITANALRFNKLKFINCFYILLTRAETPNVASTLRPMATEPRSA